MGKLIPDEAWKAVDWSRSSVQIAADMGVCRHTVARYAKLHDKPLRDGRELWAKRQAACGAQWKAVNWSLRDCDIAREVGVSRQRVWQMRRQLGKLPGQIKE